jgi:hypothetical protein
MMKKSTLVVMILLTIPAALFSQKFYIQAKGGYAFGTLKDQVHSESYSCDFNIPYDSIYNESFGYTNNPWSFGGGGLLQLGIGLELSPNIAIELTGFYNPLKTLEYKTEEYYNIPSGGYYIDFNYKHTYKGTSFGVIPAVRFQFGNGTVQPYSRIGLMFAFMSITYDFDCDLINTHPLYYPMESYCYTLEYKQKLNLGLDVAAGINIPLADRLAFFVEASGQFISYIPKKAEYTAYTINGTDILDQLTTYERQIEFVSEYETTTDPPQDEPQKHLKSSFPFSNLGIMVGLRFNFYD